MDYFGYVPDVNARAVERERLLDGIRDGWSPERRELRELLLRLRARYGRRRLFRVGDVANIVREIREEVPPPVWAPDTPALVEVRQAPTGNSRVTRLVIDVTRET